MGLRGPGVQRTSSKELRNPAQDKVDRGYYDYYVFLINFWDRSDSVPTLLLICKTLFRSPSESESKPLVYTLHANGRMRVCLLLVGIYIHIYTYIVCLDWSFILLKVECPELWALWLLNGELRTENREWRTPLQPKIKSKPMNFF